MATDVADWTQSVVVQSGSVSITGTATVLISGTVPVTMSGNPQVQISNVPSVSIASGSVNIGTVSGNISIINAAGTKITSSRPPLELGVLANSANPVTQTFTLPADAQAVAVILVTPLAGFTHVRLKWTTAALMSWVPLDLFTFTQSVYVLPILPQTRDSNNASLTSVDLLVSGGALFTSEVQLVALFESNPAWLEYFAPPFAQPNQAPMVAGSAALANVTAAWLVAPVANVKISIFEIITLYLKGVAGSDYYIVGHSATLPVALPVVGSWLFKSGNTQAYSYEYHGATLPAGDGIWIWNGSGGALEQWHELNYSLS